MGNSLGSAFGLGGLGWFFVPAPLAKPAFLARSAQVTLDNAQTLGSAKTPWQKAMGIFQLQHNVKGLAREVGYKQPKKKTNINSILNDSFAKGPAGSSPIKLEGEFAAVPSLQFFFTEFRIEGVTRDNFIDKFINGIIEKKKNDDKYTIGVLYNFREQIDKLTFLKVYNEVKIISDNQKKIIDIQENIKATKIANEEFGAGFMKEELEQLQNELVKLQKQKENLEKIRNEDTAFLNKVPPHTDKEIKKHFHLNDSKFFKIELFITKNYWDFHAKITNKIKELQERFNEQEKNSKSANEEYVIGIKRIIAEHNSFFRILHTLFDKIAGNKDKGDDEKGADFTKLMEMKEIINKILEKNSVESGYQNMLQLYGNKRIDYENTLSFDLQPKILKFYKNKQNIKIKTPFYSEKIVAGMSNAGIKSLRERKLDIKGLQAALNELIIELCTKYGIDPNPETMKTMLPPITLRKSLNYKKLIGIVQNLVLSEIKDPNEYIKILKLELCIHEFMTRLDGSNYEKFSVEYYSTIIDKKLKKIIPDFDDQVAKLKTEISGKTVEQLKTETNELLDELGKKYITNFKNSNKIGNITNMNSNNVTRPVNVAGTGNVTGKGNVVNNPTSVVNVINNGNRKNNVAGTGNVTGKGNVVNNPISAVNVINNGNRKNNAASVVNVISNGNSKIQKLPLQQPMKMLNTPPNILPLISSSAAGGCSKKIKKCKYF